MSKEKKEKKLWKGIFMFKHTIYTEYVAAYTEKQAMVQILRRIANKQGVSYTIAANYVNENRTYSITEEVKNGN